jgi:uncharacterized protein
MVEEKRSIMKIGERIEKEFVQAMRDKAALKLSTLRMLKAAVKNREIEKRGPLDDGEWIKTIQALIKQRKDSVEQYRLGKREELAAKEEGEIAILEGYLPAMLGDADLEKVIRAVIGDLAAAGPKDMGKVMKETMNRLAGQAFDGKRVSELVKQILSA